MGASRTPYTQTLSRKSHRKSRLGCKNCKRRRIKCDEIKPHCTNCLRHSIECDYSFKPQTNPSPSPQSQQSDSVSPPSQGPSTDSYTFYTSSSVNFQPPKRGHGTALTSGPDTTEPSPPSDNDLVKRPFQYTALDMLLFHHFSTSPELTGAQPKARQQLSQIAFSHHYVMHILLAFSGFHLVRRSDDQQWSQSMGFTEAEIYTEAERHFNVAIRDVSATLPHLDRDNSPAMYASAIFIFISSLARGPQPGEYLAFRSDGTPGHLSLFLGVRSVFELCSGDMPTSVFSIHGEGDDSSSRTTPQTEHENSHIASQNKTKLEDYPHHLETYRALLTTTIPIDDPRLSIYLQTLDRLGHSLDAIMGPDPQGTMGMALFPLVFAWLYQLPDAVVSDLQRREPVALILFAFFLYPLDRLDHVWFICGWPRHILEGIQWHLDGRYREYIQWAVDHVGGGRLSEGLGGGMEVVSR